MPVMRAATIAANNIALGTTCAGKGLHGAEGCPWPSGRTPVCEMCRYQTKETLQVGDVLVDNGRDKPIDHIRDGKKI